MPAMRLSLLLAALMAASALAEEKPAAAPAAPTPAPKLSDLFGDIILARGKGFEIKQSQLDEAFISYRANLAARGESVGSDDQRQYKEAQLLDRIIVTQILVNRATTGDRIRAKELFQKFLAESKKNASSEEAFSRHLKSLGLTAEQFEKRVMEQALSEAVIERELKSKIVVADTQVRDFYNNGTDGIVKIMQEQLERLAKDPKTGPDQLAAIKEQIDRLRKANLARLEQPERIHVIHLLRTTLNRETEQPLPEEQKQIKRQEIDKLLARARRGEDFAKLVKEFSEDRGLKETGGEYTLSRDDQFVPEFKSAAFSLQPQQVSDVVTTVFGYHIIKLLEKIPPKKVEFEKVSADIKDALSQQELQKTLPNHFDKLKAEAEVKILDDRYKLATPGQGGSAAAKS
jgi:parvulin-like peptidyl-prolyl isomerase